MGSGRMEQVGGAIAPATAGAVLVILALLVSACGALGSALEGESSEVDAGRTTTTNSGDGAQNDDSDDDDGSNDDSGGDSDNPTDTTPEATGSSQDWATQDLVLNPIAETDSPVALVGRSGTGDLYVANKSGTVQRITRNTSKNSPDRFDVVGTPVLDITEEVSGDSEQGLLNLTFSSDGRDLYVFYTDLSGDSVVDRYDMGSRSVQIDTRTEIVRVDQPFANHNGGGLAFGPDGFLYVGFGDGGSAGDPEEAGQDPNTLLGSIIRIDPDGAGEDEPYAIPSGNPFVEEGGAPEVWLTGVRNPWRFSFDSETGALWIADVGQDRFEEINVLPDGGMQANLGWNEMEGREPFDGGSEPSDHTAPLLAYAHENGRCSVTGGDVYRGEFLTAFDGVYVFADYCSGELFGAKETADGVVFSTLSASVDPGELGSFGIDEEGEIFLLNLDAGVINRVEPTEADIEAAKIAAEEAEKQAELEAEAEAERQAEAEAEDG